MLSERKKLEEELVFLKESYDIGVITDQEYENGRQRIGAKIKIIEEKENEGDKADGGFAKAKGVAPKVNDKVVKRRVVVFAGDTDDFA